MLRGPIRRAAGLIAVVLVVAACGREPPGTVPATVSLLAWDGDFLSPSSPVLISPSGERHPVGPSLPSVEVIRTAPSGHRAAILAVDPAREPLQLYVFDLEAEGPIHQRDVPGLARAQDLAWSPDGAYLAVVRETGVVVFDVETLQPVATLDGLGRLSGPLTGEIWASDSSQLALGATGGIAIVRLDGSVDVLPFAAPLPHPSAALFAGWSPEGQLLALDPSTEIYYAIAASPGARWDASLPAEPLFDYVASVRASADAAYSMLPGGTVSHSRSAGAGRAVLSVVWKSAGIDDGLQRGPFDVAVAVVLPGAEPVTFTFDNRPAFAGLREGRLVDIVLPPKRPQ
ncbi:MAG: hypothetical protein R3B97_17010 [Dehalococcoidia bacterium]|nr:hypothetical protein [Dehalococcoidia bacterium]MCB9485420.1 hypothetical protein [Thermoflexaceae bacterium]